jgi:hypothetical protein
MPHAIAHENTIIDAVIVFILICYSPNIGQSERVTYHSRSPYSFTFGHSSPVRSVTRVLFAQSLQYREPSICTRSLCGANRLRTGKIPLSGIFSFAHLVRSIVRYRVQFAYPFARFVRSRVLWRYVCCADCLLLLSAFRVWYYKI